MAREEEHSSHSNPYEAQRLARIADNKRKLEELLGKDLPAGGRGPPVRPRRPLAENQGRATSVQYSGGPREPPRRSRRNQEPRSPWKGLEAPLERALSSAPARKPTPKLEDVQAVDQHNYMRFKTMSVQALRTRIRKIKRVDKLESFVRIMEEMAEEELAEEAREALADLTGNPRL